MRTFVALELPERFAIETAALSRKLEAALEGRFLASSTHHLTLAFLGEVGEPEIAAATDALEAACTDVPPLSLRSDGLGKFGRANDSTLWLGIASTPQLERLARAVREQLAARGVAFDPKPFKPHVTLARRVRIPRTDLPALAFPEDDGATTVTLFKSTLGREGAMYRPLHSTPLTGAAGR